VVTAVVGVAPALSQAALFEFVDEEHEPAGRSAQPAGDGLLALPGLHAHQAEQPCLGRREIEAGDPRDAARLLALRKPSARQVGSALAWAIAAAVAGLAVSLVFSPLTGGPAATLEAIVRDASDESRMPAATPLVWTLIVIRLVALTGTAEELLFRGALYSWLRGRLSAPMAIAATTALFALEHGYYPVLIPVAAAFGLAAGSVRHRTHSTAATIPMHVAIDLAMFLAAVWLA
jgi:membrane protease YdiL (CAAX protease family)